MDNQTYSSVTRLVQAGDATQLATLFEPRVDRTLRGTINGGGPEYQFTSLNGQIYIRKGK